MFDSAEELLRKIQLGEDTSLELKIVVMSGSKVKAPTRNDLADAIAAIANTSSGVIVFGVDDKARDVVGISREHLDAVERYIFEVCNENVKPPVLFRSLRMCLVPDDSISKRSYALFVAREFLHSVFNGTFNTSNEHHDGI